MDAVNLEAELVRRLNVSTPADENVSTPPYIRYLIVSTEDEAMLKTEFKIQVNESDKHPRIHFSGNKILSSEAKWRISLMVFMRLDEVETIILQR